MMEDFPSEDGRIKAHNVLRGKYDSIHLGYWPGGPNPVRLEARTGSTEFRKGRKIEHHKLAPDEQTSWILKLLFEKAAETGCRT